MDLEGISEARVAVTLMLVAWAMDGSTGNLVDLISDPVSLLHWSSVPISSPMPIDVQHISPKLGLSY
jgi:hypothetical protein